MYTNGKRKKGEKATDRRRWVNFEMLDAQIQFVKKLRVMGVKRPVIDGLLQMLETLKEDLAAGSESVLELEGPKAKPGSLEERDRDLGRLEVEPRRDQERENLAQRLQEKPWAPDLSRPVDEFH